jgi:hypothetical protein
MADKAVLEADLAMHLRTVSRTAVLRTRMAAIAADFAGHYTFSRCLLTLALELSADHRGWDAAVHSRSCPETASRNFSNFPYYSPDRLPGATWPMKS